MAGSVKLFRLIWSPSARPLRELKEASGETSLGWEWPNAVGRDHHIGAPVSPPNSLELEVTRLVCPCGRPGHVPRLPHGRRMPRAGVMKRDLLFCLLLLRHWPLRMQ